MQKAIIALALLVYSTSMAAPFQKVLIVVFENTDYRVALRQPFFGKLAREGATLENFHAETHPSQPNYIAMVAGSQLGISDNGRVDLAGESIADLLERSGKTWKVYAEGYPGRCYQDMQKGRYVRRHNPFISFRSIQNNPARCARIVEAGELADDVRAGRLPDYAFYIPDLNSDGHDTDAAYADRWYSKTFGPLLAAPQFPKDLLLVTTFDESSNSEPTNHIYTSLYGAGVKAGTTSNARYDHYSLLRTIEDALGLGNLGGVDATASAITGVWR